MRPRFPSDLTVSDYFCGAGGNTIGAKRAGLRVRVGANHWDKAIDVYGENNPEVDLVVRCDLSAVDPRRFPRTDIGIFSPECTTHSPSGGNTHRKEPDLFDPDTWGPLDPATVRSRVTMQDVIRFTEWHLYSIVIVENVVEVLRWVLFANWLNAMHILGYRHKIVSRNSMFHHPTPQSRDRVYIVFWRKGNPAPDLDFAPLAPCLRCGDVRAFQAWKPGRTVGKYRRQYDYRCPSCAAVVTPYYYAGLNAIDFRVPAERIGDKKRPIKPRTRERVRFGLHRYGRRVLVVNLKQGARDASRAWPADVRELGSIPTWDGYFGVAHPSPFLVSDQMSRRVSGVDAPLPTQTASRVHEALVTPNFLVETAQSHSERRRPRSLEEPLPTMGTQPSSALVSLAPFLVTLRSNATARPLSDPLPSVCARGNHHGLVTPFVVSAGGRETAAGSDAALPTQIGSERLAVVHGAQISMRDADAMRVAGLDAEWLAQGTKPQQAVISRAPFLVSYYGTDQAAPADAPVPTLTVLDRHAAVQPDGDEIDIDDCYFRMFEPHEIGAGMAFPADYAVKGTKRDRVKMYGNAVTPPVMDWLVERCAMTLAPEVEGRIA